MWFSARPTPTDDDIDRFVEEALVKVGLHASWAREVRRQAEKDPASDSRYCCGSACDPCVMTIGRAVDLVRRRIRRGR